MTIKVLSSLEKVFTNDKKLGKEQKKATCLKGEFFNFQIAVFSEDNAKEELSVSVESDLKVNLYAVKNIGCTFPAYNVRNDDDYITMEAGLFPDILNPVSDTFTIVGGQWRSLWVEVEPSAVSGDFSVKVNIGDNSARFDLKIIDCELPKQSLIYTQWFHYDCLATYYGAEVLSEKHFDIIGKFMDNYAKYGANMILTPVLTPPLDTLVGGERPTVQLVGIEIVDGKYVFDYSMLDKFVAIAKSKGIEYFEISHPFTQWGASSAPKVVATVDGEVKKIFGWDTDATDEKYVSFIRQFIFELKEELKKLDILDKCYFHISDEPREEHLESYTNAYNSVKDLYEDVKVMDALSSYEFYKKGLVKNPIPANDHIEPFLENNVEDLWTYYCCSQCVDVANRFLSMPSYRNRVIAEQLYQFDIVGFLHWGYNFYYSQFSKREIDPYFISDADEGFPGGDAYSVYPGEDGNPVPSLRQLVFNEALQDLRAFQLLEKLTSKEEVKALIKKQAKMDIRFNKYPKNADFILDLRAKVNELIEQKCE